MVKYDLRRIPLCSVGANDYLPLAMIIGFCPASAVFHGGIRFAIPPYLLKNKDLLGLKNLAGFLIYSLFKLKFLVITLLLKQFKTQLKVSRC